jgi:hypothetical protein
VVRTGERGPTPTYCGASCRQRSYEARRAEATVSQLLEAWHSDLGRIGRAFADASAIGEAQKSFAAAMPKFPKLIDDEAMVSFSKALGTARFGEALVASSAIGEIQKSFAAAMPKFPKLIDDEAMVSFSKALGTARFGEALVASSAIGEIQKSFAAAMPKFPNLVDDDVIAAIARSLDVSTVLDSLESARHLASAGALFDAALRQPSWLLEPARFPAFTDNCSIGSLVREVDALAQRTLTAGALRSVEALPAVEGSGLADGSADDQALVLRVALLFAVVLAAAVASLPEAPNLVLHLAHGLLEEAHFGGVLARKAYGRLALDVPDDKILGWLAALAWLVRYLKGEDDST